MVDHKNAISNEALEGKPAVQHRELDAASAEDKMRLYANLEAQKAAEQRAIQRKRVAESKTIGSLPDNHTVEIKPHSILNGTRADSGKFLIGDKQAAALPGVGSDQHHLDLVSGQGAHGFNGIFKSPDGKESYTVVDGNLYDGDGKFAGHLADDGRIQLARDGYLEAINSFKEGFSFEGTENGQSRNFKSGQDMASGSIFIPDQLGKPVAYEVRLGMIIDKATGAQYGRITAPNESADGKLSGGSIVIGNSSPEIPLANRSNVVFDLKVMGQSGVAGRHLMGACRGPLELQADGSAKPGGSGGIFNIADAIDAQNKRLEVIADRARSKVTGNDVLTAFGLGSVSDKVKTFLDPMKKAFEPAEKSLAPLQKATDQIWKSLDPAEIQAAVDRKETQTANQYNKMLRRMVESGRVSTASINAMDHIRKQTTDDLRGPVDALAQQKEQLDSAPHKKIEIPKLTTAEDLKQVNGWMRLGSDVYQIEGGQLHRLRMKDHQPIIDRDPSGQLGPHFTVEFSGQQPVRLANVNRVILQIKVGKEQKEHRIIGLGAARTTEDIGHINGGLVDVGQLFHEANDARRHANEGDLDYFNNRPYLTGGLANWAMGDREAILKDFARNLDGQSQLLHQGIDRLFQDGFNSEKFSNNKIDGNTTVTQLLMYSIGTTAQDSYSLAQDGRQLQKMTSDSAVMAATTVATAGVGTLLGAAVTAGKIGVMAAYGTEVVAGSTLGAGISVVGRASVSSNTTDNAWSGAIEGATMAAGSVLGKGVIQGSGALAKAETLAVQKAQQGLQLTQAEEHLLASATATKFTLHAVHKVSQALLQTAGFSAAGIVRQQNHDWSSFNAQNLALGTIWMLAGEGMGKGIGLAGKNYLSLSEKGLAYKIMNDTTMAYTNSSLGALTEAYEQERHRIAEQMHLDPQLVSYEMMQSRINWGNIINSMNEAGATGAITAPLLSCATHSMERGAERLFGIERDQHGEVIPAVEHHDTAVADSKNAPAEVTCSHAPTNLLPVIAPAAIGIAAPEVSVPSGAQGQQATSTPGSAPPAGGDPGAGQLQLPPAPAESSPQSLVTSGGGQPQTPPAVAGSRAQISGGSSTKHEDALRVEAQKKALEGNARMPVNRNPLSPAATTAFERLRSPEAQELSQARTTIMRDGYGRVSKIHDAGGQIVTSIEYQENSGGRPAIKKITLSDGRSFSKLQGRIWQVESRSADSDTTNVHDERLEVRLTNSGRLTITSATDIETILPDHRSRVEKRYADGGYYETTGGRTSRIGTADNIYDFIYDSNGNIAKISSSRGESFAQDPRRPGFFAQYQDGRRIGPVTDLMVNSDGSFQYRDQYALFTRRIDGSVEKAHNAYNFPILEEVNAQAEYKRLEYLAGLIPTQPEREGIKKSMLAFQAHALDKGGVGAMEVGRVYHRVSELLMAKQALVPAAERAILAEQILRNATFPLQTKQGHRKTCVVSSGSVRIYSRHPSEAAARIKEAAVDGSVRVQSGRTIKIRPRDLVMDAEARLERDLHPEPNGERNYADQILTLASMNAFWQHQVLDPDGEACQSGDLQYRQEKPGSSSDTGERLVNILNQKEYTDPTVSPINLEFIYNELTHHPETFIFAHQKQGLNLSQRQMFSNEKGLLKQIQKFNVSPNNPMVMMIDVISEPFARECGDGQAGGSGGNHVVSIVGWQEMNGQPYLYIDNTWDPEHEHTPESGKPISLHDFYLATLPPESLERLQILKADSVTDAIKLVEFWRARYEYSRQITQKREASQSVRRKSRATRMAPIEATSAIAPWDEPEIDDKSLHLAISRDQYKQQLLEMLEQLDSWPLKPNSPYKGTRFRDFLYVEDCLSGALGRILEEEENERFITKITAPEGEFDFDGTSSSSSDSASP